MIWDALRAACEADIATARTIIDSAGIIVSADDMSICYDERGTWPTHVHIDPPAYALPAGAGNYLPFPLALRLAGPSAPPQRGPAASGRGAGRKYELPQYVLSDPSNLVKEKHHGSSKRRSSSGGGSGQVELPVSGAAAAAGS